MVAEDITYTGNKDGEGGQGDGDRGEGGFFLQLAV